MKQTMQVDKLLNLTELSKSKIVEDPANKSILTSTVHQQQLIPDEKPCLEAL